MPSLLVVCSQGFPNGPAHAVEIEDAGADEKATGTLQSSDVRSVTIRLAESVDPVVRNDLDDRSERERLVCPDGVQKWAVAKRDRCHMDGRDPMFGAGGRW